jgi:superfamily II DNA or RNA helicase
LPKLNTFDDFYDAVKIFKNPKDIGTMFEIFTKYLFILHPFYSNLIQDIWLYDEVPDFIIKDRNVTKKDKGIDIIIHTKTNLFYAVQCKFRNNKDPSVPWKDLSTFVGMTFGIGKFDGAYYVTNTYRVNEEIKLSEKIICLYGEFFDKLDKDFFHVMSKYVETNKINIDCYTSKTMRDYQVTFLEKALDHFANNNRGHINICCGAGKTLMAYWLYKNLDCNVAIICVPSLYLLSQFYNEWSREVHIDNKNTDFILVGSDVDIDDDDKDIKKDILNGIKATTDEAEILVAMYDTLHRKHKAIIITTYQSADKILLSKKSLKYTVDLCIFDEAHKTCGKSGAQFSLFIKDSVIKIDKRLFMTATPRIYSKVGAVDESIMSMDKKEYYGDEIFKYSIREGINDKFLVDYQILTLLTDDKYIENYVNDNMLVSCEELKDIDSYYLASAIMIIKSINKHDCNHMLTYHSTVAGSKKMESILKCIAKKLDLSINVYQLDGKSSMKTRANVIAEFKKNKCSVLASARVFNEGVNIIDIDSVCFVDPRESTIDIIQCIGRALRPSKNKSMAKVLIPYICNNINEIENDKLYFPQLINVIKSISETDTSVKQYFVENKKGKVINRNIKFINYLSQVIKKDIGEKIDLDGWTNNINTIIWQKIDYFEYMFAKLEEFVKVNNRLPFHLTKEKEEKLLYSWCCIVKVHQKNNRLTENQIQKFKTIPSWEWIKRTQRFATMLQEFKEFIAKNDKMPSLKIDTEKRLGIWASTVRARYRLNNLSQDVIDEFKVIPHWYWNPPSILLFEKYPDLKAELHPTKNININSDKLTCSSHKKVWWVCSKGHEYEMMIFEKVKTKNCKQCWLDNSNFQKCFPELMKQWHPTKNSEFDLTTLTFGAYIKVWWKCDKGHEWEALISNRTKLQHGCPFCTCRQVCDDNSLVKQYPEIAKQWHPSKNGELTPNDVTYGSNKKAWWKCKYNHTWQAVISARTQKGSGCLYCCGHLKTTEDSLETKFPELSKEWNYEKNATLKPDKIGPKSIKKAWWKCENGHEWMSQIRDRTRGIGCPECYKNIHN